MEQMRFAPGRLAQSFDTSPLTMEKMRMDSYNKQPGNLKDWDCPECRNKGDIAFLDGERMRVRECGCMVKRRCIRKMQESGLKDVVRKYTFDSYSDEASWQQTMKQIAQDYARQPTGWLLMAGQSGCGKTHLCTAVCRELLLRGMEVVYMPWREDTAQLKAMSLDNEDRAKLMRRLKNAPVLYIDDLLWHNRSDSNASPTNADVNLAFELLNHRACSGLRTIISTELSPQELMRINEAVAGRILDNAGKHICTINPDQRKNHRLRGINGRTNTAGAKP